MPSSPHDLYRAGQLGAAIQALAERLRERPTDVEPRSLLAELLCVRGDLERADAHLEVLATQLPAAAQSGALQLRQLVRAEQWRQDFHAAGRAPAVLGALDGAARLAIEASIALREARAADAAESLARAEQARIHPRGVLDGAAFDDWRDGDDVCASVLELLTSTGKFYWVPWERVRSLEFAPPRRPLDLVWRHAEIEVDGGPHGQVWMPTTYAPLRADTSDALRMGSATEWDESPEGIVRGRGLRAFLVGDEARHALELGGASFECSARAIDRAVDHATS